MDKGTTPGRSRSPLSASFITGAIALVFLVIGYQVALFVHKAAATALLAKRDKPDTVFVVDRTLAEELIGNAAKPEEAEAAKPVIIRRSAAHSADAVKVREKLSQRKVESFRFNPNTVSIEDLQRLGFSEKQAASIDRYRQKGGRFRRASDFAKSYVVADSVYERLKPFIDIPLLDINKADSTALLDLPGIGPYFAGKIVQYRKRLGGYSCTEQLMEIYHFDKEKYDGLKDLVKCSPPVPYDIWNIPEDSLSQHPHISRQEAHSIVLFRQHNAAAECTLEGMKKAGILSDEHYAGLSRCKLASKQF